MESTRFYLCYPHTANLSFINDAANPAFRLTRPPANLYTRRNLYTREVIVKLHLANLGETKLFTDYSDTHVSVNRERFETSIAVMGEEVRTDWNACDFDALTDAHFEYFLALKPEVILMGTGAAQRFAHPRLYRALTNAGIGVEFMNTPAACRTYNILAEEGRKVIAAILL